MVEGGTVERRAIEGGVICSAPGYAGTYWGHRLETCSPPWRAGVEVWLRRWRDEHGAGAPAEAMLAWEQEDDLDAPMFPPGVRVERLHALQLAGTPPIVSVDADVRRLGLGDWPALMELATEVIGHSLGGDAGGYLRWHWGRARALFEQGRSERWGAFSEGRLVATAGVVWDAYEGRYQDVLTHEGMRRRGYARALVTACARSRREAAPDAPLTIVARADSPAEGLYRSLGFARRSTCLEIAARAPRTGETIRALTRDFESGSLPTSEWGHREHLSVASQVLRETGLELRPALVWMRETLQRYLVAQGIGRDRYHETITRGWLELVRLQLLLRPHDSLSDAVLGVTLQLADKRRLLAHWSRDVLAGGEARVRWCPPDLAPLA